MENNKKLAIQSFIEQHSDWEDLLGREPYCLEIKRDIVFGRRFVLFKYNMIGSDFSIGLVRECRGIVLDEDTNEVVVFPFTKFFNYSEPYADDIDWSTASVQAKLDGSIIKIIKISEDRLLMGTNSNIDATKCVFPPQVGCSAKTWGDLILDGISYYGLNEKSLAEKLEYGKTYIFELTSPFNQIVVRWPDTRLNFIGIRDNRTFLEEKYENHPLADIFVTPAIYPLRNLTSCVEETFKMGDNEEGYVVRDDNFHRIKVKSPRYLELHRLAGNGILSIERGIEVVQKGETMEMIAYFPHFKPALDDLQARYNALCDRMNTQWRVFTESVGISVPRKTAAEWINANFDMPGIGFAMLDGRISSVVECLAGLPAKKLIKYMGLERQTG